MKRLIIVTLIAVLGLVAFVPTPAQAAQVFCRVPTNHKVVCYNYTPWSVHMNVTVRTSNGPRYFRFWMPYTKWVHYFAPVVYNVNWRWHF